MSISNKIKLHLYPLGRAYCSPFLIDSPKLGIFFAALTFLYPNIAVSGLISLVSSYLLLKNLTLGRGSIKEGVVLYNSLLIGLYIGYLFQLDHLTMVLIFACSALTLFTTFFLESFFRPHYLLILSVPFTLIASLLSLSARFLTNLVDATVYFRENQPWFNDFLPSVINIFFRAIGGIYCIPDANLGLFLWTLVTLRSPMIGVFLLIGFGLGYFVESSFQIQGLMNVGSHYFNYSLTLAAISGVIFYPSRFSLGLGIVATIVTNLITFGSLAFWNLFHIPITAIPYNFTVLLLMRSLLTLQPLRVASYYGGDPESTIDQSRIFILRYRWDEPRLFCPFEGQWTVQQGFDGPWTHRGFWKHGLDFTISDSEGKTFKNQGHDLTDYYAFGQAILSPVEGYVVDLCSSLDDNAIIRVENQQNWGNYIIIKTIYGYWVALAHLKKDSVTIKLNDYVSVGQKIAECGNSGYSQEPHIHLQIQYSPKIGSYTSPFHLMNYLEKDHLHFHQVPSMNSKIEPAPYNLALERVLTFRLGEKMTFETVKKSKKSKITIEVALDEIKGTLYLTDGKSRLYFSRIGVQFYFYQFVGKPNSFLGHLMLAGPRIPMIYKTQVQYRDHLPSRLTDSTLRRWWRLWITMLSKTYQEKGVLYHFNPDSLEIQGSILVRNKPLKTYLRMDPVHGFQEVRVGGAHYVRTT